MVKRLLVKTQGSEQVRSRVWNVDEPMPLGHPALWLLVNGDTGVRIIHLKGAKGKVEANRVSFVPYEEIRENGMEKYLDAEGQQICVSIRECSNVRGAHFSTRFRLLPKEANAQLWVYSGVRKAAEASSPIHKAYIGYYGLKPLFLAYSENEMVRIKALSHGLILKERGKEAIPLGTKSVTDIAITPGNHLTLRRRMHWWRFQLVSLPVGAVQKLSTKAAPLEDDFDLKRTSAMVICFICLALLIIELFGPEQISPPTSTPAPQEARLLPRKNKEPRKPNMENAETPLAASLPENTPKVAEPESQPEPVAEIAQPVAKETLKPHPKLSDTQKVRMEAFRQADFLRRAFLGSKLASVSEKSSDTILTKGTISKNLATSQETKQTPTVANAVELNQQNPVEKIGGESVQKVAPVFDRPGSSAEWVGGSKKSFMNISGGGSAVEEGLSRDEVAAVIRAHMSEVRYCHEASLIKDPKIAGKVTLHFEVTGEGKVKEAKEEASNMSNSDLSKCILRRLESWQFPKPRGGVSVNVSFPFLFKILEGA